MPSSSGTSMSAQPQGSSIPVSVPVPVSLSVVGSPPVLPVALVVPVPEVVPDVVPLVVPSVVVVAPTLVLLVSDCVVPTESESVPLGLVPAVVLVLALVCEPAVVMDVPSLVPGDVPEAVLESDVPPSSPHANASASEGIKESQRVRVGFTTRPR